MSEPNQLDGMFYANIIAKLKNGDFDFPNQDEKGLPTKKVINQLFEGVSTALLIRIRDCIMVILRERRKELKPHSYDCITRLREQNPCPNCEIPFYSYEEYFNHSCKPTEKQPDPILKDLEHIKQVLDHSGTSEWQVCYELHDVIKKIYEKIVEGGTK